MVYSKFLLTIIFAIFILGNSSVKAISADDCPQEFKTEATFQSILKILGRTCYTQDGLRDQLIGILGEFPGVFTVSQLQRLFDALISHNLGYVTNDFKVLNNQIPYMSTTEIISVIEKAGNPYDRWLFLKVSINYVKDLNEQKKVLIFNAIELGEESAIYGVFERYRLQSCLFKSIDENNVTFIIDRSGSMKQTFTNSKGKSYTRFDYVVENLNGILGSFDSNKRFNVIMFSTSVSTWKTNPVKATPQNINEAKAWVNSYSPDGATNLNAALMKGYDQAAIEAIYLLTDGAPSAGVTDHDDIVDNVQARYNQHQVPIHSTSFMRGGTETNAQRIDAQRILKDASQITNGSYKQIS